MAKSDDIARLPLPIGWPKLAKRVLVLVNEYETNTSFCGA
jgi:hypothetical protein